MTDAVEQSRTRWVAEALAVAAAYVVAATLRFVFPFTEQGASWVWLPSGVRVGRPPSSRAFHVARRGAGFLSSVWPTNDAGTGIRRGRLRARRSLIATTIIMRRGVLTSGSKRELAMRLLLAAVVASAVTLSSAPGTSPS
jgi:hypothetical protein